MGVAGLLGLLLSIAAVATAEAGQTSSSCKQISAACKKAGFVKGGSNDGRGIGNDCIKPIMQSLSPSDGKIPLPAIDPGVISACRLETPAFRGTAPFVPKGKPPVPVEPAQVITPLPGGLTKPNIVFVLTDDLSMNLLPHMPNVQAMQSDGVTFANYFVTNSLCCPSRSSIFTGKFPHNTGVLTNEPPDGGFEVFNARGNDTETFALALQQEGYRTAMLGKYLNGYEPKEHDPPPGWSEWDVAGDGYLEFNYDLNRNGRVVHYGKEPDDYLTDVIAGIADKFIRKSASRPFFIEIATFAPHTPYTPAPRDADKFPGLLAPRDPSYGARPDANAPRWLQNIPPLSPGESVHIDEDFRKRAQSVAAVDKMIGDLRATLDSLGIADRTYVIFSSDNGYHMGEFSLRPGKMTPFDTDTHVPLVVVGPGVAKGTVRDEYVENVDLCPTFTDLGGGGYGPTKPDGRSIVPLLLGASGGDWRQSVLVEHHRSGYFAISDPDAPMPNSSDPITYQALRTPDALYVEYEDGEISFYDLRSDPNQLKNIAGGMRVDDLQQFRAAIAASRQCAGSMACLEAQRMPTIAAGTLSQAP